MSQLHMLHLRSLSRIVVIRLMLIASIMVSTTVQAATATLDSLIPGGSLIEGDVVFDNFFFQDNSDFPAFPDREVIPSQISLSTSASASSVSLTTTIDPALALTGDDAIFNFFMDFDLSIVGSSRMLSSVEIGDGDLHATGGDAQTGVIFFPGGFGSGDHIEIFEDTVFGSQTDDMHTLGSLVTAMLFESVIGGFTAPNSTAGLSTFELTFNLEDSTPPPSVVPVPAAVWLFGSALIGMIGFGKRRKNS